MDEVSQDGLGKDVRPNYEADAIAASAEDDEPPEGNPYDIKFGDIEEFIHAFWDQVKAKADAEAPDILKSAEEAGLQVVDLVAPQRCGDVRQLMTAAILLTPMDNLTPMDRQDIDNARAAIVHVAKRLAMRLSAYEMMVEAGTQKQGD